MSSIDDRIVNMQFNNAQFQQGIEQSNASLQELKGNLNLDGASAGLDAVQATANRFSLQGIEDALDNVSSKFSIFGAVGFTAIQDITNDALNAGKNIADNLINPLVQGGATRALAIQQAQFQFKGLGLNIADTMAAATQAVTGTAYSLDQAATAAAQLGASGITVTTGLEPDLRAIAGVAAQTGQSFSGVANVFEEVAGQGRLMGQNLLELSDEGVNAAATLAKYLGTTEANVRTMVTAGKISFQQFSDAMNAAFGANAANANQTYSGALDNMHAALARIGADFASPYFLGARDIFNALGPLFDNIHHALGPLVTDFTNLVQLGSAQGVNIISNILGPGVVAVVQNLISAFESLKGILVGSFQEIFPDNTVANLTAISVWVQKVTAALTPGTQAAEELHETFLGIFAVFDIVGQIIGSVVSALARLFGVIAPVSGGFLEITARIGLFLYALDNTIKSSQFFQDFFKGLSDIIAVPIAVLRTFFNIVADGIQDFSGFGKASSDINNFASDVSGRFKALGAILVGLNDFFKGVEDVASKVWAFLEPIFAGIADFIGQAVTNIHEYLDSLSFDNVQAGLQTGLFAGFIFVIRGEFGKIQGLLRGNGVAIISSIKQVLTTLRVTLTAFQDSLKAKTLEEIAIAVALLAVSAVAMSNVNEQKLGIAMGAIAGFITELFLAFAAFSKVGGSKSVAQALALSISIESIAAAILILSVAIALLGALPMDNLIQGVIGLTVVLAALVIGMRVLAGAGPQVLAGAGAIALIAPALLILSGVIAVLGALPFLNIVQGVVALAGVMLILVGSLALMSKLGPQVLLGAGAIYIIAPAIAILAGAISLLGALPFLNLVQGVLAFTAVMLVMSVALVVLSNVGPAIILAALAIALIAVALVPLIGAIALIGKLPLGDLIQGVVGLAAVLVVLTAILLVLGYVAPVALLGAVSLIAMSIALAIIAPAFKLLSTISWDGIGRGITALAAAIVVLAIGGVLLIPASVGFLLFGIAVALFGTGLKAAGEGAILLALGIGLLVAVGAGGIALFGLAIQQFIKLLPSLGVGIGGAFVSMVIAIGNQAPSLIEAFVKILIAMLAAIDRVVPQIIQTATDIIVALINAFTVLIPLLINLGLTIIVALLTGIANNIYQITTQAINIIVNFVNALADNLGKIIDAGGNLVLSYINGIATYVKNNSGKFVTAGSNLFLAIVDGVSAAIEKGGKLLREAGGKIGNALIQGANNALGINSPSKVFRDKIMGSVFEGIENGNDTDRATAIGTSIGTSVATGAVASVKSAVAGISDALSSNIDTTPTIRPVVDLTDIQSAGTKIAGMLNTNPTLSVGTSNSVATSVALQEEQKNATLSLEPDISGKTGGNLYYTQNNTSPVALTTPEIYRQTNNQLSTLRGDLGVVNQTGSPE